ncbi:hypothetical protein TNIN_167221 [Trichonephila inaurata madagascariensis]|uniref:Uncharacterized protein n=1 Tax=Trichonephila inaurata madagascariensis TaxID=2747483 RepID=A0A8X6XHD9_9ARAC|nr:hypothetical protein TNIN_167221 [Trichonephila inaurata madagascariensis]
MCSALRSVGIFCRVPPRHGPPQAADPRAARPQRWPQLDRETLHLQLDRAAEQCHRRRGHLHGLFWIRRRFHDDCSSPPAGQRLVKPGHRGLFAGHAAQRHLSQAEGAVPEDGPTSQSLIPGGLVLAQEQTQESQVSALLSCPLQQNIISGLSLPRKRYLIQYSKALE